MQQEVIGGQAPIVREIDVSADAHASGATAVELLAEACVLSRGRIKDAMSKGAVWCRKARQGRERGRARRLRRAKSKPNTGDRLSIYYNPVVLAETCLRASLVDDGGDYSVWDKPAGMLCQGSRWGDHCTLLRYAEQQLASRTAFVVHRLDRMASGLVVLAHSKHAARSLSEQFAQRQVGKNYRCTVEGQFSLQAPLLLDTPLAGKEARTWIESASSAASGPDGGPRTELLLRIETGRKHQIRQHLALAGLPIVGDTLYGDSGDGDSSTTFGQEITSTDYDGPSIAARARPQANSEKLQLRAVRLAFKEPKSGLFTEWNID
ncbi:MAG: RNA pseudouridine synthase [Gammaproteobacteria bacterium]|nr:RNA pseudouridine synthase [Gammaproteobacteria bacterium]MBT8151983.1 RNA pseudouridine synthase [Gammaproteobacteria bacterium]NNL10851.1 RNA pseudouridine synthase [Pseudomonadales bacterium]NNM12388.1 RNA pseudouridine synthase [Pseudomonadales bacterium]RZV55677.1 MAG: RNA pseudouridine synthase [Pseudomonadales bacterium]